MKKQRKKHSFKALLKYFYIDIFPVSYTHPSLSRLRHLRSLCGRAPRVTHTPHSHSPAAAPQRGSLLSRGPHGAPKYTPSPPPFFLTPKEGTKGSQTGEEQRRDADTEAQPAGQRLTKTGLR